MIENWAEHYSDAARRIQSLQTLDHPTQADHVDPQNGHKVEMCRSHYLRKGQAWRFKNLLSPEELNLASERYLGRPYQPQKSVPGGNRPPQPARVPSGAGQASQHGAVAGPSRPSGPSIVTENPALGSKPLSTSNALAPNPGATDANGSLVSYHVVDGKPRTERLPVCGSKPPMEYYVGRGKFERPQNR
jgi:hypothetical protein